MILDHRERARPQKTWQAQWQAPFLWIIREIRIAFAKQLNQSPPHGFTPSPKQRSKAEKFLSLAAAELTIRRYRISVY